VQYLLLIISGVLPLETKNNWQASLSTGSFVQPTSGHTIHQLRGICKHDKGEYHLLWGLVCGWNTTSEMSAELILGIVT